MNDLTIRQPLQFSGSPEHSLTVELAKMLGLVAPITMSADQQTLWLASAVDSLSGFRPSEVEAVSVEVRRSVTRPSQIVPEIARLVGERRARESLFREAAQPVLPSPCKKHVMDRRGQPMTEGETEQLNGILENLGATARYRPDGSRYMIGDTN